MLYLQLHPEKGVLMINTNDSAVVELVEYNPMNSSCSTYLNGLPYRVSKGYAMLLLVTKLVSIFRVITKICCTVLCTQIMFYSCVT